MHRSVWFLRENWASCLYLYAKRYKPDNQIDKHIYHICKNMYICICVYVFMCICVYVYLCICVYVYMCVRVYMCICVYACIHVNMYMYRYMRTYMSMYKVYLQPSICICVYMFIYIYIYVQVHVYIRSFLRTSFLLVIDSLRRISRKTPLSPQLSGTQSFTKPANHKLHHLCIHS